MHANFVGSADGLKIGVEAATAHVANGGMQLNFPQAFFMDMRNGEVRRVQAYEPYSPHGNAGVILTITQRK